MRAGTFCLGQEKVLKDGGLSRSERGGRDEYYNWKDELHEVEERNHFLSR